MKSGGNSKTQEDSDDARRLNALASPTAATRQHRFFRTISRGSGSGSTASGAEPTIPSNRHSRIHQSSYLQSKNAIPNMTSRGAIVARDEEDEEILQQLSSSTAVSLPSKTKGGGSEQGSDCQMCSVPGNIEISESLSSVIDGAVSSLKNSFSTSTNTNLDHHEEYRYSQHQNHSKQNLDLRNNDNSFHVLASLLVDFLKSKIVYDDAGAVVVLCHDDFVAIHRLLPESARSDFIDAVRFRLELTPVIPISPLQCLTLTCQELGMDLDSTSENPILAATAAIQNNTPITTILTIPIQNQNGGQRMSYLFQNQSKQVSDYFNHEDDTAYERARRRIQRGTVDRRERDVGDEMEEELQTEDESFVVPSVQPMSSSSSDSSSIVHVASRHDVADQITADGLHVTYYGEDTEQISARSHEEGKKTRSHEDGKIPKNDEFHPADNEDAFCKLKNMTSPALTEQETEDEECSVQPNPAEDEEESRKQIQSRSSAERAATSDLNKDIEDVDIIDILKARIKMEQKTEAKTGERTNNHVGQNDKCVNPALQNDMRQVSGLRSPDLSTPEDRILACASSVQQKGLSQEYQLNSPCIADVTHSYEEAFKAVAMSIAVQEKTARASMDEQIMSFDFKKFEQFKGPEKIAVQQMIAELREGLAMMNQSETSETIEFWRNQVLNLQTRLQAIYDEKMAMQSASEPVVRTTSAQSSRFLRKPDPRATSPSSQPSFCMTVEQKIASMKPLRRKGKQDKEATKEPKDQCLLAPPEVAATQKNQSTNSVIIEHNIQKSEKHVYSFGGSVQDSLGTSNSKQMPDDPCKVLPSCTAQLEHTTLQTIELTQYISLTDHNNIMHPSTKLETNAFKDAKQSRQDYVDYCNEVPLVDVVAPADLPGGYHFEAEIEGKRFLATVPPGGVQQGETFTCYMRELDAAPIDIPIGRWKDGLCNLFAHGLCHPALWNALFCPLIALGQIQTRIDLDFLGRPRFGTDIVSNRLMMWIVITFWAFMNVGIFIACNVKWSRGMELSLADAGAFALVNVAMLGFVVFVTQSTRNSLREKFVISEECCFDLEDLCCATLCLPCTVSQMSRHTANYDDYEAVCCSETGLPDGVRVEKGFDEETNAYVV
jgi:Cys-rich protein (TIGR01571 family)